MEHALQNKNLKYLVLFVSTPRVGMIVENRTHATTSMAFFKILKVVVHLIVQTYSMVRVPLVLILHVCVSLTASANWKELVEATTRMVDQNVMT